MSLEGLTDASQQAKGFSDDVKGIGAAATEATTAAAPLTPASDAMAGALRQAAAAAREAAEALAKAAPAIKEPVVALTALEMASKTAQAALDKLGNIQGVRGLSIGIVQAQLAVENFRKSAQAAGTDVSSSLATMQGSVTAATQRLGTLRQAQADVGASAQQMGASWKTAAAQGGSLQGMMLGLAETSTGTSSALAKLALGGLGVVAAWELGQAAGKKINETIEANRSAVGGETSALAGLAKVIGDTNVAGAGFKKWADDAAKSANYFSDEMQPVIEKINTLMAVHRAAAAQLAADEAALKLVGVAWEDVGHESTRTAAQIKLVDDALVRARLAGQDQIKTIELNAKALQELKQRLEDEGISLDSLSPRLRTAILLSQGLAEAHDRHAAAVKLLASGMTTLNPEVTKLLNTLQQEDAAALKTGGSVLKLSQDHDEAVRALVAMAKSLGLTAEETVKYVVEQDKLRVATIAATAEGVDRMEAALRKQGVALDEVAAKTETYAQAQARLASQTAAVNSEFEKQEQFIKNRNAAIVTGTEVLDKYGNATQQAQGQEAKWTPLWLTVTAATDAQNASLDKLLQTTNAYSAALSGTLDKAKGWKDYLAGLVDSYQTGQISLLAYKNALTDFASQLALTFSGATGKAREAIEAMRIAIQRLIDTAGGGPLAPFDATATGFLNRTFNTP